MFWNELGSQILTVVLAIVAAAVVGLVIEILRVTVLFLRAKLKAANPTLSDIFDKAIEMGVRASEQLGITGQLQEKAVDKLENAVGVADQYLLLHGFDIDAEVIVGGIEAKVNALFGKQ